MTAAAAADAPASVRPDRLSPPVQVRLPLEETPGGAGPAVVDTIRGLRGEARALGLRRPPSAAVAGAGGVDD